MVCLAPFLIDKNVLDSHGYRLQEKAITQSGLSFHQPFIIHSL